MPVHPVGEASQSIVRRVKETTTYHLVLQSTPEALPTATQSDATKLRLAGWWTDVVLSIKVSNPIGVQLLLD